MRIFYMTLLSLVSLINNTKKHKMLRAANGGHKTLIALYN